MFICPFISLFFYRFILLCNSYMATQYQFMFLRKIYRNELNCDHKQLLLIFKIGNCTYRGQIWLNLNSRFSNVSYYFLFATQTWHVRSLSLSLWACLHLELTSVLGGPITNGQLYVQVWCIDWTLHTLQSSRSDHIQRFYF